MFLVQGIHRWMVYVFTYTYVTAVSLIPRDVTHTSVSNVQKVVNRPAFIYFHLGGGGVVLKWFQYFIWRTCWLVFICVLVCEQYCSVFIVQNTSQSMLLIRMDRRTRLVFVSRINRRVIFYS
jgi:hypothetical protein